MALPGDFQVPPPHPAGRRRADQYRFWVIVVVVGCLFQGGNFFIVKALLAADQRNRDAERAMQASQHADLMEHLRQDNVTNDKLADSIRSAVNVLQTKAEATAEKGRSRKPRAAPLPPSKPPGTE